MYHVGMRVRVKDNYAGGLDKVVGRTGKILRITPEGLYLLDIKGQRKASWGDYMYDHEVIAEENEIDSVDFSLTDSMGRKIELGDKIAYGPLGGGVTVGTVVDIDERVGRYGRTTVKFRLESNVKDYHSDGGDRIISGNPLKSYRWYEHTGRCVVIQKNPINDNVFNLNIPTY